MLKDQNPTDSMDDIIDLTEIVQKGKPPRVASKDVVDFDSALSDLMGKVPEGKMQENPELEELLSGIDEVAHERRGREAQEDDAMNDNGLDDSGAGDDKFSQVESADDMDALLSSIDGQHKPVSQTRKAQQPAEDVDSLLDSLMDDIEPPASGAERAAPQEISEADLDDLLDTIEQESTGKTPAEQEAPQDSLDDLLSSLDDLPPVSKAPKAAAPAKSLEEEAPLGSLDDLFDSIAPPKADRPSPGMLEPEPVAPKAPESLDDLLGDILPKPVPKPMPRAPERKDTLDSLDDLLGGILPSSSGTGDQESSPGGVDSLDDLLGDLAPSSARRSLDVKPPVDPKLAAALGNLEELLSELPPKPVGKTAEAAKPLASPVDGSGDDEGNILDSFIEVGGIESMEEIDGILDGLDDSAPEPLPLPDDTPSSENFGDLAAMFAPGTETEDDDEVVCADGTSFTAEDMTDLDSMFGSTAGAEDPLPEAPSTAVQATPPQANAKPADPIARPASPADVSADPFAQSAGGSAGIEGAISDVAESVPGPEAFDPVFLPPVEKAQPAAAVATAVPFVEMDAAMPQTMPAAMPEVVFNPQPAGADAQELHRRVAMLESELHALQARVHTLEAANAMEMRQEQVSAMLEDGSPLSNRLTALMRMAISQELTALNDQGERHADSVAELESRTEALEAALAVTEANSVPEPRVAELESRTEAVESGLGRVDLLESRTNALETTLTQVAAQAGAAVAAPPDPALRADLGSLENRVNSLEESTQSLIDPQESLQQLSERLATLETRPYIPIETIQDAFDQMGAQLNKPLQQFQNRITTLESRLNDELPQLAGELVPFMTEHIERAAAESAARALREELAALLSDADASADEDADPQV